MSPPSLYVETGIPDGPHLLAPLTTEDRYYNFFYWARGQQDRWSQEFHRGFWLSALRQWPRRGSGEIPAAELVALAHERLRRDGLSDADAAQRLGYAQGSPQSMRRRSWRDAPAAFEALKKGRPRAAREAVEDYMLPRIFADGDPAPNFAAYPNYDDADLPDDLRRLDILEPLAESIGI
jgi:hypothetical protein